MVNFVGEYPRQLDDRGRFILPAKIREKLSGTVYITRSPIDKCLNLYTEEEWLAIAEKVRALPTVTDRNAAALQRQLFGKAISCELDKQGRVPLSAELINFANMMLSLRTMKWRAISSMMPFLREMLKLRTC